MKEDKKYFSTLFSLIWVGSCVAGFIGIFIGIIAEQKIALIIGLILLLIFFMILLWVTLTDKEEKKG